MIFIRVILALVFALPLSLSGRQLKSADGSKVMDAEFIRYIGNRDKVALKVNGRELVLSADKFSEEDRKFFVETQLEIDKKQAIQVKTSPKGIFSKEKFGFMLLSHRTTHYKFEVTNTSDSYFDGLELRYWIVVELHNQKTGEGQIKIESDRKQLMPLPGGASEIVESPIIKLTLGAKSASATRCPSARRDEAAKAAAVERDRVIGTKVEVLDDSGQVLFSEVSSNRVESLLADKKTD